MITLRKADPKPDGIDSKLLWGWRNDPVTRQMSRTTDELPWENHQAWYAKAAIDPKKTLLLAQEQNNSVGMVRFDTMDATSAEISINLNPAIRGKGLGRRMLSAACAYAWESLKLARIYAEIKPENIPSMKLFEGIGFVYQGQHEGMRTYYLTKGETMIRNAKESDMDDIMRVEEEAWPAEIRAPREKFENRLKLFPQGFYVALMDGRVMGVTTSEIIPYDSAHPVEKWEAVTDNGWIAKTHTPQGNALYVVSVGVSPLAGGKGIGSQLVQAQKKLVQELKLDCLVLGARCPGYGQAKYDAVKVEDYVCLQRDDKQLEDPELRFYTRNGLSVVKPILRYMDEDPESRHYGIVMEWRNPAKQ